MATFKAVVSHYKKSDGTYRVFIRVTHNRKYKDIGTPFYVTSKQITRGFKIKDLSLMDKIDEKIKEYRATALNIGFAGESLSIQEYVGLLNAKTADVDFFEWWQKYIDETNKEKRYHTAELHTSAFDKFKKFYGKEVLYFSEITPQLFLSYYEYLKDLSNNTKISYIGLLKTAYHYAQKRLNSNVLGEVIVRYGVFDLIELPQKTKQKDNAITTVEMMQRLIDCPYAGTWYSNFAKDMFILSFLCFGTNTADFLAMKKEQYKNGILYYRRKKIARQSGENADMQVRVPEAGRIILDKYSGDNTYLISFGDKARSGYFTRFIHHYFIKIGLEKNCNGKYGYLIGDYTFYAARHTMATLARNVCGIDFMTVHEMLNHATPSNLQTTDTYIFRDYSKIWEANEKLYNLFNWDFYLNQKKQ